MLRRLFRIARWANAFALLGLLSIAPAFGATGSAYLSGTVTANGKPVANATVSATGNNSTSSTRSNAEGAFSFSALPIGAYTLRADGSDCKATQRVDLNADGATVTLDLTLRTIGTATVVRSTPIRGSGTDVTLNSALLQRSPASGSFPEFLIQLPGAVRGANGVVHLNGDHGVVNYFVDGVPIPQALNRNIGSEIDPNDIAFVDVVEGSFPAQYGLRFGSTLNISTRAGTGPAGFDGEIRGGSYGNADQSIGYHTPLGAGGGLSVAVRDQRSTRGLDPPNFGSPHNDFSNTNQFMRLVLPRGQNRFTDLTMIHAYRSYQIPNDVDGGQPATTDDGERQEDTFLNLQFRQAIGDSGSFSFGPALKVSRVRDYGDPTNDFAYGQALHLAAGGAPADCATALTTGNYSNGTCGFSLRDDKTSTDYRFQSDYVQHFGHHEVRAGGAFEYTNVGKRYAVTLQPNNYLAPTLSPTTPNAAYTVVDHNPNRGRTTESYVQDSWKLGTYEIDYGLRYDFFSIASTDFGQGFGSFSPRIKLVRSFGQRANVYAYLGRLFEPFSFENVDPAAAQLLNLPLQPTAAQFDLKPERDTFLELGGHVPLGGGSLGLRVWQKNANDLIDDTQVGVTLLHQDINYTLGRISQEAAYYERPLAREGRIYASAAHTDSFNKGCETQLLAPCFGSPTVFTPADHDQSYSVTGGALLNDRHDGWLSFDGEYGTGLSSASCPSTTTGNCKRTPHTVFGLEKGIGLAKDTALTIRVQNVFNDRYFVTLLNAQGNHYATPRTIDVGLRFGR